MDLIEWSAFRDVEKRQEIRSEWRRYFYNLACEHYRLAEINRKKMLEFGAELDEETETEGSAA